MIFHLLTLSTLDSRYTTHSINSIQSLPFPSYFYPHPRFNYQHHRCSCEHNVAIGHPKLLPRYTHFLTSFIACYSIASGATSPLPRATCLILPTPRAPLFHRRRHYTHPVHQGASTFWLHAIAACEIALSTLASSAFPQRLGSLSQSLPHLSAVFEACNLDSPW